MMPGEYQHAIFFSDFRDYNLENMLKDWIPIVLEGAGWRLWYTRERRWWVLNVKSTRKMEFAQTKRNLRGRGKFEV